MAFQKYKTYSVLEGRSRAAIVVANKKLDTVLIHQLTEADTVTVEIILGNINLIAISMYFDREKPIEHDFVKMESALQYAKGIALLFSTDSNARSTLWYDKLTNTRGRILEEFLISKRLYIMNKDSNITTFSNSLGTSNINMTIISTQLLNKVSGWTSSEQESISDHNFIKYVIKHSIPIWHSETTPILRYETNKESFTRFHGNVHKIMRSVSQIKHNDTSAEDLDDSLLLTTK